MTAIEYRSRRKENHGEGHASVWGHWSEWAYFTPLGDPAALPDSTPRGTRLFAEMLAAAAKTVDPDPQGPFATSVTITIDYGPEQDEYKVRLADKDDHRRRLSTGRVTMPSEQQLAARIRMATTGWDCTCTPYPHGTGPEVDCPVHGIQACVIQELVDAITQHHENVSSLGLGNHGQGNYAWGGPYDWQLWSVLGLPIHPEGALSDTAPNDGQTEADRSSIGPVRA